MTGVARAAIKAFLIAAFGALGLNRRVEGPPFLSNDPAECSYLEPGKTSAARGRLPQHAANKRNGPSFEA